MTTLSTGSDESFRLALPGPKVTAGEASLPKGLLFPPRTVRQPRASRGRQGLFTAPPRAQLTKRRRFAFKLRFIFQETFSSKKASNQSTAKASNASLPLRRAREWKCVGLSVCGPCPLPARSAPRRPEKGQLLSNAQQLRDATETPGAAGKRRPYRPQLAPPRPRCSPAPAPQREGT